MNTFIANLKHAIRNKEIVCIGGGYFDTSELEKLLNALVSLQRYEKNGVTCQTYRFPLKVSGCAECNLEG